MMYFTCRDLEVKAGEMAYLLFEQRRVGQFSMLKFGPIYADVLYLSCFKR